MPPHSDEKLTTIERSNLARFVDAHGEVDAAKCLGVGRDSLLRALASRPVRRATMIVLRDALSKINGKE